ncbi:DUF1348 family protein [Xanthobacteraceae bacterium Astr-EGSB]|uniref:DUF1348 family protein n=1 Tax=Astrobacterium formosum TaxID=3069710 RepID=UPI0027B2D3F1|nr:DUF1348 family protein [Xanthobacteraceae bacterium Astr-EGSB]
MSKLQAEEIELAARVRAAEDAWNTREIDAVVRSSTIDCQWRIRTDFLWGREQIRAFIARKWRRELELRMVQELWAWTGHKIAIRISSEFCTDSGTWFRAYGNENWECNEAGLVHRRLSCINEHPIEEHERVLRWPAGPRPAGYPTLSELGL